MGKPGKTEALVVSCLAAAAVLTFALDALHAPAWLTKVSLVFALVAALAPLARHAHEPIVWIVWTVLVVIVAVAAYGLGHAGARQSPQELPRSISNTHIRLSYPEDWKALTNVPEFPGLMLPQAVGVAPALPHGAGVVAGMARATGAALLDRDLLGRLARAPSHDDRVFLGDVEAYRYGSLRVRGFGGRLTLFVAPTTAGVLTVACYSDPSSGATFAAPCERVAHAIRLTRARKYTLGPSRRYETALNAVIGRLNDAQARTRRCVHGAAGTCSLAATTAFLGQTASQAADVLRRMPVSPTDAGANRRLVTALDDAHDAYAQVARTAAGRNPVAHAASLARARSAERRLRRALWALTPLGYVAA
jgi:hypothetical protein